MPTQFFILLCPISEVILHSELTESQTLKLNTDYSFTNSATND